MNRLTFYLGSQTPALKAAAEALKLRGCPVVARPCSAVTHLLLPVPSLDIEGRIRGGGELREVLSALPAGVTIIGGQLPGELAQSYRVMDLLEDPSYLAENAAITAHCAIAQTLHRLPVTLTDLPVLVIGWGRIGKCLAMLLKGMGAKVTVAARKEADRAMARALGCKALTLTQAEPEDYRVIYNTVPAPVLSQEALSCCVPGCLKMDLASVAGLGGEDVVWARGLPGRYAPESSGKLIARTVLKLLGKEASA